MAAIGSRMTAFPRSSQMKSSAWLSFFLVLFFVTFIFFPVVTHWNEKMLAGSGDGIKAYTVFAGHIKNDTGYLDYSNMNYPYGQSHIYTDGQFILANGFKFLSKFFPWIITHSIGIFNLMILLSYPLCAYVLTLIFSRLQLPKWYSVLAAVATTILAPQIFRISGHVTLPYAVCIPLSWLMMINYYETGKRKYSIFISLLSIFWFFVHPYYTMILLFFNLISFVFIFKKIPVLNTKQKLIDFSVQIILPLVITNVFVRLTDHHIGRPVTPVGFWSYFATWQSVFMPITDPLKNFINYYIDINDQPWEGAVFVGLPATVLVIFIVFRFFRFWSKSKLKVAFQRFTYSWLEISLIASVLILLYSMCIPFKWKMESLVEILSPLKQFRALGRFAWMFYFVFSVYTYRQFYLMFRSLKIRKAMPMGITFLLFIFLLNFSSGYSQFKDAASNATDIPNLFNEKVLPPSLKSLTEEINKVKDKYQCILPLPYFNIGSDNFQTMESEAIMKASFIVSYHCNFPIMGNSSARSPLPEARKLMQLIGPPSLNKEVQADLPSKKPFLILLSTEALNLNESYWRDQSVKIWNNEEYELRELTYDQIFSSDQAMVWNEYDAKMDSLIPASNGFYLTKPSYFYFNPTDSVSSDIAYRNHASFQNTKNNFAILMKNQKTGLEAGKDYILSFWFYNNDDMINEGEFCIAEVDPVTKKEEWAYTFSPMRTFSIDGNWSCVEKVFRVSSSDKLISLFFIPVPHRKSRYYADEFMIREVGCDAYKVLKSNKEGKVVEMIKNNYNFVRP